MGSLLRQVPLHDTGEKCRGQEVQAIDTMWSPGLTRGQCYTVLKWSSADINKTLLTDLNFRMLYMFK